MENQVEQKQAIQDSNIINEGNNDQQIFQNNNDEQKVQPNEGEQSINQQQDNEKLLKEQQKMQEEIEDYKQNLLELIKNRNKISQDELQNIKEQMEKQRTFEIYQIQIIMEELEKLKQILEEKNNVKSKFQSTELYRSTKLGYNEEFNEIYFFINGQREQLSNQFEIMRQNSIYDKELIDINQDYRIEYIESFKQKQQFKEQIFSQSQNLIQNGTRIKLKFEKIKLFGQSWLRDLLDKEQKQIEEEQNQKQFGRQEQDETQEQDKEADQIKQKQFSFKICYQFFDQDYQEIKNVNIKTKQYSEEEILRLNYDELEFDENQNPILQKQFLSLDNKKLEIDLIDFISENVNYFNNFTDYLLNGSFQLFFYDESTFFAFGVAFISFNKLLKRDQDQEFFKINQKINIYSLDLKEILAELEVNLISEQIENIQNERQKKFLNKQKFKLCQKKLKKVDLQENMVVELDEEERKKLLINKYKNQKKNPDQANSINIYQQTLIERAQRIKEFQQQQWIIQLMKQTSKWEIIDEIMVLEQNQIDITLGESKLIQIDLDNNSQNQKKQFEIEFEFKEPLGENLFYLVENKQELKYYYKCLGLDEKVAFNCAISGNKILLDPQEKITILLKYTQLQKEKNFKLLVVVKIKTNNQVYLVVRYLFKYRNPFYHLNYKIQEPRVGTVENNIPMLRDYFILTDEKPFLKSIQNNFHVEFWSETEFKLTYKTPKQREKTLFLDFIIYQDSYGISIIDRISVEITFLQRKIYDAKKFDIDQKGQEEIKYFNKLENSLKCRIFFQDPKKLIQLIEANNDEAFNIKSQEEQKITFLFSNPSNKIENVYAHLIDIENQKIIEKWNLELLPKNTLKITDTFTFYCKINQPKSYRILYQNKLSDFHQFQITSSEEDLLQVIDEQLPIERGAFESIRVGISEPLMELETKVFILVQDEEENTLDTFLINIIIQND